MDKDKLLAKLEALLKLRRRRLDYLSAGKSDEEKRLIREIASLKAEVESEQEKKERLDKLPDLNEDDPPSRQGLHRLSDDDHGGVA